MIGHQLERAIPLREHHGRRARTGLRHNPMCYAPYQIWTVGCQIADACPSPIHQRTPTASVASRVLGDLLIFALFAFDTTSVLAA